MTATPPSAPETATTALYRAALGPVNVGRYLPVFARFDEAGRAGPGWNWAAALLTLNWLVFRQLWGVALVYVAAVEGLFLLVWGLGRDGLAPASLTEWGFLGALLVLSCLIPGAYGNAWLHADTRRRMTRAVRDAPTVRDACGALARRASGRRRLWGLVIINGVLAGSAAGAYLGLAHWMPGVPASPSVVLPGSPPVEPPSPVLPPPPVVPPAAAPTPTAQPPAEAPPAAPVEPAQPAVAAPGEPVAVEPASPSPRPAAAPPGVAAAAGGFAINVGLFADAANADRVHSRLLDAGLPAYIQVVDSPKGRRTRVRVGPFASRTLADDAAARIRALGLDAVVFRQ